MAALDFFVTVTVEYGTEGNGTALDSDDEGILIPGHHCSKQMHNYMNFVRQ